MKRRRHLKLLSTAITWPALISMKWSDKIDFNEIIGKVQPELFGNGYKLRRLAHLDFEKMKAAASKAGFNVFSVSSYRSFNDQKRIWNTKYTRFTSEGSTPEEAIDRIIEYSTIPGTSRHHWGTDIDIVDGNKEVTGDRLLPQLFSQGKPYGPFKKWLNENAQKYGFIEVYTDDPGRKGFKYEPWHFSYKPLSKDYLAQYQEIGFNKLLKGLDIQGSQFFNDKFIEKYWDDNMMDINPELKS